MLSQLQDPRYAILNAYSRSNQSPRYNERTLEAGLQLLFNHSVFRNGLRGGVIPFFSAFFDGTRSHTSARSMTSHGEAIFVVIEESCVDERNRK
jgi:hypothetical protein